MAAPPLEDGAEKATDSSPLEDVMEEIAGAEGAD